MDLLGQYSDDEEAGGAVTSDSGPAAAAQKHPLGLAAVPKHAARPKAAASPGQLGMELVALPMVDAAPMVDLLGVDKVQNFAIAPTDKKLFTNPSFAALNKPLQGPVPVGQRNLDSKFRNHKCGNVEKLSMSKFSFDEQYHTFHNFGYAANPGKVVTWGDDVLESTEATHIRRDATMWDKAVKKRRLAADDDGAEDLFAARAQPTEVAEQWGGFVDEACVRKQLAEEVKDREQEVARQAEEERAVEGEERETKERITSIFHGTKETDYAGRSWIENKVQMPKDVDDKQCFLPKKWLHTWSGHTMGVQAIRWFPETAHLLLSAGLDSKIMIWDYHNQRKCLRTYQGHDQAVRDINFTSDGRRFYSVSYDKNVQYWDTETGQVISTFTNKKTPFCVSVHPDPSQQNVIVTGCSNKKAVQWDANSCSIVQEYDEHLGAVNSVTFCEEGRRLLTTSDDKKIFIWEYGIPVVVKYIHETTMHSVPSVCLSANKKFLIGQSMDNKIITYEAFKSFKFQAKRQFKGHMCSGYAIQPGFSPDGRWVVSGDADGKLWFWDWQKMKNYRVLKAHDGVCIGVLWHPLQTSRVVSCGWDGAIKLWD